MTPTRRAFTLIELLVVILILAVMAALVVPAFAGYLEKARFDGEVRRIQDYFALARERAVKGDITVTLHFERGIHQFSITFDPLPPQNDLPTAMLTSDGTDPTQPPDVQPYAIGDEYRVESFTVSTPVSQNSPSQGPTNQSDVHFNGDGTSDGADIDLISQQGFTAHLSLSPMTGRLTLEAPTGP